MKKVLLAGAALMLAGGIATTADAAVEPGVKITGNARARIIYKDSYDFGNIANKDSELNMDSRARFVLTGTAAGGAYVKGRIRLQDGRFGTQTGGATPPGNLNDFADPDANNIWVDYAFLGVPFTDAFAVEGGKIRVTYGNGFAYDDIGVSGFRGVYKTKEVMVVPFVNLAVEGQSSRNPTDRLEDNDVYQVGAAAQGMSGDWTFGAMAFYQDDSRSTSPFSTTVAGVTTVTTPGANQEGIIATAYAKGKVAGFGLEGELSYAEADYQLTEDDGFGFYIRPSYTINALTLSMDFGMTQDGFQSDPFYGFVMIGGEEPIGAVAIGSTGDWLWVGGTAKYAVSEALKLTGNLVWASIDGNDNLPVTDPRLGNAWELSGVLQYTISKGADFYWFIGYLQPDFDGRLDGRGVNDDAALGSYAKFEVSF